MRTALLTGGAQGLGRSLAEALLKRGNKVCVCDVKEEVGQTAVAEMAGQFGADKVIFAPCDVRREEQIHAAWSSCEEKLGSPNLLINNAGIGNEVDWKKTVDVNLIGTMQSSFFGLKKMSKEAGGEGGIVMNVASIAGLSPLPLGPTYTATKHGIVGISRALGHPIVAKKSGVNFLCLCPSLFDSSFMEEAMKTPFDKRAVMSRQKTRALIDILSIADVEAAAMQLLDENKPAGVLALLTKEQGPFYVDCLSIM